MTPLRDAAENATAGVPVVAYRTDIFESLPNGKLSRLILEAGEVSNPDPDWTPLVPASELDTARAEIERLTKERDAARVEADHHERLELANAESAMEEMTRADEATTALTAAQARIAELEGALSKIDHEYETEYAGRSYTRCTCCHVALSDGHPHLADCAWATLSPAVKEPK